MLKTLGTCALLLVAPVPIAMQIARTSTMAHGARTLAQSQSSHGVTIVVHCGTFWNGYVVFGEVRHVHT